MMFSSDDDLPAVPPAPTCIPQDTVAQHAMRLHRLEEQFEQFKLEMRRPQDAPVGNGRQGHGSTPPESNAAMPISISGPPTNSIDEERGEAAQYELRSLVQHLSPSFDCSFRDAVLIISAIRNGGAGGHGGESLMDRVSILEAEKRTLEQRLERLRRECAVLHNDVAEARQKVSAVKQESQQSTGLLAQRREEMRKQLLLEETRTQKLQVRNRKLEIEMAELKARIHTSRT